MIYTEFIYSYTQSDSESRLVFRNNSEGDNDPTTPNTSLEAFNKKKKEHIARMTRVKSQVSSATFDDDLESTANRIISNYEDDPEEYEQELLLLEKYLKGPRDKKAFRKEYAKLTEKKERARNAKSAIGDSAFSDRVGQVYQNKAEKLLDSPHVDDSFRNDVSALAGINKKISMIDGDIRQRFVQHIKNGEISKKQVEKIVMLDPNHKLFEQKLRELLGPLASDSSLVNFIKEKKVLQAKKDKEAEAIMMRINEVLQVFFVETEFLKKRRCDIDVLKTRTGLNIEEGTEYDILIPTGNNKFFKSKAKIKAIDYKPFDRELDPDLDIAKYVEKGMASEAQLQITVTYKNPEGQEVEEQLGQNAFLKFTVEYQATEPIEDANALENKVNHFAAKPQIKVGQEFEYRRDFAAPGKSEYSTVTIKKIDAEKQEITLSEPIQINGYTKQEDSVPHIKSTVSFEEFYKWMNLRDAVTKVNLDNARSTLSDYPKVLQARLEEIDLDYKVNPAPIKIEENEYLKNIASGEILKIESATDTQIKLSNGTTYTPSQFVRFVKEEGIEKLNESNGDLYTTLQEIEQGVPYWDQVGSGEIEASQMGRGKEYAKHAPKGKDRILAEKDTMHKKSGSFNLLGDITKSTTMLSLKNLFDIGSTVGEFINRRWTRNGKARMAKVGSKLPMVGPEFDKIAQQTENEEVSNYQDVMKDFPVIQIRDRLKQTSNKDELKACMNLLSEKGALRFDDTDLWKTLNRVANKQFGSNKAYYLSVNLNGGKNKKNLIPADAAKDILDELYGEESGKEWFNKNLSSYKSAVSGYSDEANSYEGDPKRMGGIAAEIHNMLIDHMNGVYVDTGRFEGFIDFIIKAGKATMTDKIFYLMAGVAMENEDGKTLLDPEVYTRMTLNYQGAQLPLLEWFTRFKPPGFDGTILPKEYLKDVVADFGFKKDARNESESSNRYNLEKVNDYLTKNILPHNSALSRASRAIRNSKEMDHDDTQYIIPYLNKDDMQSSVVSNTAGDRTAFTADGFLNGFAGFSEAFKAQGEVLDGGPEAILERKELGFEDPKNMSARLIKSFIAFESSATGRRNYGKNFLKINESLSRKIPVGLKGTTTQDYIDQIKNIIEQVANAYGIDPTLTNRVLKHTAVDQADQNQHENDYNEFYRVFDAAVNSDNGRRLVDIIRREYSKLYGC